tara:strand:- start:48 stop:335 length:288 start_codon:yes stop_codon:yes gene_type:complete
VKLLEDKTINKVNQLNDNLYFSFELDKPFMELAKEIKQEIEHLEDIRLICFKCEDYTKSLNGWYDLCDSSHHSKEYNRLELIKELIGEELANTIY